MHFRKNLLILNCRNNLFSKNRSLLEQSKFILTDNVGLGTAWAWELHRSNICLYEKSDELKYSFNYLDSKFHLVKEKTSLNGSVNHIKRTNFSSSFIA